VDIASSEDTSKPLIIIQEMSALYRDSRQNYRTKWWLWHE